MGIDFYAKFAPEDRDNVVKEVLAYYNVNTYGLFVYNSVRKAVEAVKAVTDPALHLAMEYALWQGVYNGIDGIADINRLFPGGIDNDDSISLGNQRYFRLIVSEVDPHYRTNGGYFPDCGSTNDRLTIREILGRTFADFGIADALLPYVTNIYWA